MTSVFLSCGGWDLNPHVLPDTRSLVLPVCQFQHLRATNGILAQRFMFGKWKIKKLDRTYLTVKNTAMNFGLTIHGGTVT